MRVNCLIPGFIETPLLNGTGNRKSNEPIRERVRAAGLEITPVEEVAKAIYFLLSDYASEVNGVMLDVNGGDWVAA